MTNRDKIDVLQKAIDERFKAIKQMKEAIEAHQSMIQELTEELEELKREDLYGNLKSNLTANDIMRFPKVDVEPVKHAHWIKTLSPYHFKCSSCRVIENIKYHSVEDHKFCWYCGAKMDGKVEEADDET